MSTKKQKLIMVIVFLIILLIALLITLKVLDDKEKENVEGTIHVTSSGRAEALPEGDMNIKYDPKELREPTEFFSVEQCIKNNLNENFKAEKMNYLQGERIITYSVFGTISLSNINEVEEKYLEVRVDMSNMTFEIKDLSNNNYENINQIELKDDETAIVDNGNNSFEYIAVSNEEMCNKYLEDFKQKELYNPEEAYSLLAEETKEQKFPTLENFQTYINNNKIQIENSKLEKYTVNRLEDYTEYIIIDNYDNSYFIRTTGVIDYTINIY